MSKKWVYLGGAVVLVIGYMLYRASLQQKADNQTQSGSDVAAVNAVNYAVPPSVGALPNQPNSPSVNYGGSPAFLNSTTYTRAVPGEGPVLNPIESVNG